MSNNGSGPGNLQSQVSVNLNRFAWRTNRNLPIDAEALDILLYNKGYLTEKDPIESDKERKAYIAKREELLKQLFVAATKVLTDVQFQFFTAYHVLGMSEIQIATAFDVTQPYVSIVLTACIKKIKKHLLV